MFTLDSEGYRTGSVSPEDEADSEPSVEDVLDAEYPT